MGLCKFVHWWCWRVWHLKSLNSGKRFTEKLFWRIPTCSLKLLASVIECQVTIGVMVLVMSIKCQSLRESRSFMSPLVSLLAHRLRLFITVSSWSVLMPHPKKVFEKFLKSSVSTCSPVSTLFLQVYTFIWGKFLIQLYVYDTNLWALQSLFCSVQAL